MMNVTNAELGSTPIANSIDVILVPQGAEYQAVCRGLKAKSSQKPEVIAIPMGCQSLGTYLQHWKQSREFLNKPPRNVLLMGLCGGLSPKYKVGEIVIYSGCSYSDETNLLLNPVVNNRVLWQDCDPDLVTLLQEQLKEKATLVKGLTSDRLIGLAQEKHKLYQQSQMDVVDMEGFTALNILTEMGIKVAMIRVVSDESEQNLPNLSSAISSDGSLNFFLLTRAMIERPLAGIRLIQSSLKGLWVLQHLSHLIFKVSSNDRSDRTDQAL